MTSASGSAMCLERARRTRSLRRPRPGTRARDKPRSARQIPEESVSEPPAKPSARERGELGREHPETLAARASLAGWTKEAGGRGS